MVVHVVGNVGLDTTFRLARFPRPGETLNASEVGVALGGKGANQALAALRAGADATLWSAVGSDSEAGLVRRGLMDAGLSDRGLSALPLPTDRSAVLVDAAGENQIASAVACAQAFDPLASRWFETARRGDVLVLQGNLAPDATRTALETGRDRGLRTILNASPLRLDCDMLDGMPAVVIVNRIEGETLTTEREPGRMIEALCRRTGGAAVVTLGADGFVFAPAPGEEIQSCPAVPARSLDTSGAGDVFCGTFAARLSLGDGFEPALRLAGWAAAIAVTRVGTFGCGPSRSEFMTRHEREHMSTPSQPIGQAAGDTLHAIFGTRRAIIGVVHLAPLPGSPRHDGEAVETIYQRGLDDARAYLGGGCDGVIVENHGDVPFSKPDAIGPETSAHMAVVADRIRRELGRPIGINVLANAAIPALAIASAAGAAFVRVNQWANAYVANEGFVEGEAARAMRYRAQLRAKGIRIFADAHVKHGAHAIVADRPVEEQVKDLVFFDADVVIATGQRTGHAAELSYIRMIKEAVNLPTLVGSGVTRENVGDILSVADGVIVASSLKYEGVWWNQVDPDRVKAFTGSLPR